ncbi:MAG: hypothetical protein Q8P95_01235 [bacterium]|nr:hypothetical protein [bacterium]
MKTVPVSLRRWFLFHFAIDMLFGIPLMIAPGFLFDLFGIAGENFLMARMVGAALIGIGGASLVVHRAGTEVFLALLNLKLIWASSALVAIGLSIWEGGPQIFWLFFAIFAGFWLVWGYYRMRMWG